VSVSALSSGPSADACPNSLTSHWCISGYILYSCCRLTFQFWLLYHLPKSIHFNRCHLASNTSWTSECPQLTVTLWRRLMKSLLLVSVIFRHASGFQWYTKEDLKTDARWNYSICRLTLRKHLTASQQRWWCIIADPFMGSGTVCRFRRQRLCG
jgi:hypothetical protein